MKTFDLDVRQRCGDLRQHLRPFGESKKRRLFSVPKDRYDQPVEYLGTPFDQVEVTIGHRIERTGIDGQHWFHDKIESHFIADLPRSKEKSPEGVGYDQQNCELTVG